MTTPTWINKKVQDTGKNRPSSVNVGWINSAHILAALPQSQLVYCERAADSSLDVVTVDRVHYLPFYYMSRAREDENSIVEPDDVRRWETISHTSESGSMVLNSFISTVSLVQQHWFH